MHRATLALAAAAALAGPLCAGATAPAAPAAVAVAGLDNAALLYWRAFDLNDARRGDEYVELMSGVWDAYLEGDDGALAPGTPLATKLAGEQDVVRLVLKAAEADECDFEIDYSEGFNTLLPHLGKMRRLTRLVLSDARRLELAGDLSGSVDRTVATYRMADHVTYDGVLINSLVGVAIANVAHKQTERLAAKDISDADRQRLLSALASLRDFDPFNMAGAIRLEQRIVREWVAENYTGDDAAARLYTEMFHTNPNTEPDEEILAELRALDEAAFHAQVEQAAALYDRVVDALYAADGDERMKTLQAELEAGEHGVVARIIVPSFGNAIRSARQAREELTRVRQLLAKDDE